MEPPSDNAKPLKQAFADHRRDWRDFSYVYPVISRRSGGLSIGINLNPDGICNFDCIYCCVDRSTPLPRQEVELPRLEHELARMRDVVSTGELWQDPRFADIPASHRRLNDIAFSGNGEPTQARCFEQAVDLVIAQVQDRGLDEIKIVVITNASALNEPSVERVMAKLDQHRGEIWAKLDAGDEQTLRQVNKSSVPFRKLLDNILACGRRRAIVIQSLWMRIHDQPPTQDQTDAFAARLYELTQAGCQIKAVHLYTVARQTAQPWVTPLTPDELKAISAKIDPAMHVEVFV